jgi:hypothetical protein
VKKSAFIILLFTILFLNCGKENENPDPVENLVYTSLVAEKSTLIPGENTKIKATATGSNLSYNWSASRGDILGSGHEVIYAPSPCHVGTNQITCKITNGKQSESKTITIQVLED